MSKIKVEDDPLVRKIKELHRLETQEEALMEKLDLISDGDPNYYSSIIEYPESLKQEQPAAKKQLRKNAAMSPNKKARNERDDGRDEDDRWRFTNNYSSVQSLQQVATIDVSEN